jgi:hypothetical protein
VVRKKTGTPSPTVLRVPLDEARKKLDAQIAQGKALREQTRITRTGGNVIPGAKKWDDYNITLLGSLFSGDDAQYEYLAISGDIDVVATDPFGGAFRNLDDKIRERIEKLESVAERLELWEDKPASPEVTPLPPGNEVFIVHGHDNEAKESVARVVERQGYKATILH